MSLRRKVFQGAMSLAAGQALGQGLSFVRNVIVARLLSPEDFGVAATFAITVSLFEMLSDLAVDKLIIQAKDGDDPRLQATAQAFQSLRGLICGLLTAALAWPIALLFGTPEALWAYMLLGLVPLLRGVAHLDVGRLQREMRFGPAVTTQVGSQLAAVLVAWPLARWLGDWSAMLWIVLIQSAVLALLSHVVARRPYAWAWDAVQLRRLLTFGWPLLINGVLMFGVYQGDRLIIGSAYSTTSLGYFAAAATIAFFVSGFLFKSTGDVLLPVFARASADRLRFTSYYRRSAQAFAVLAILVAGPIYFLSGPIIKNAYGEKYAPAAPLLALLVISQVIRVLRNAPVVAALATGDTLMSPFTNGGRLFSIPILIGLAYFGAPLENVALAIVGSECLGFWIAVVRLKKLHAIELSATLLPATATAATLLVVVFAQSMMSTLEPAHAMVVSLVIVVTGACSVVALFPDLRADVVRLCLPRSIVRT